MIEENGPDLNDERTEPGFGSYLLKLNTGNYSSDEMKVIIETAKNLANGDPELLIELRRTLISLLGSRCGNQTSVVLNFENPMGQEELLII